MIQYIIWFIISGTGWWLEGGVVGG